MSILGSHFNTQDLTEDEKRQYNKIVQLREKREKMQSNKKWRNEKEDREKTLDKLTNQIDSLEQTLYDKYMMRMQLIVAWSAAATAKGTSAACESANWTRRTATTTGRNTRENRQCCRSQRKC